MVCCVILNILVWNHLTMNLKYYIVDAKPISYLAIKMSQHLVFCGDGSRVTCSTICSLNCPISAVLVFFVTISWCIAEPKCAAASGCKCCLAGGGSGDVASSFRSELSAATPVEEAAQCLDWRAFCEWWFCWFGEIRCASQLFLQICLVPARQGYL